MFIKKKQPQPGDTAHGLHTEPPAAQTLAADVVEAVQPASPLSSLKIRRKSADEASSGTASNPLERFRNQRTGSASEVTPKKRIFQRSKAASDDVADTVKPEKKGLFGSKKRDPKKPAAPKSAMRSSAPTNAIDVLVELEGNRRVCWRVGSASLEELPLERAARAASFSRNEHRYSADQPLKYGQAQDLALAEIGEDVRIVNASRLTGAVYASTAERITELGALQTGPGLLLLELLLKGERTDGEELVFGLLLSGGQDSRSLAVLYHLTKDGEVAATQVTVNPDNLTFVLQQFASSRRMDAETARFVLFKNEDLLRVAGKLQLYPNEPMWNGVSLRRALWTAAMGAVVVALGCGGYAANNWLSVKNTKAQLSAATAKKKSASKAIDALLVTSVGSFAHTQALSLPQLTERAGKLWSPGSKVLVDAQPIKEQYFVSMPLTRGGQIGANPSVLNPLSLADVRPLLLVEPPEGCSKNVPQISGGMNAVQITVTCESASSPLSAFRLN